MLAFCSLYINYILYVILIIFTAHHLKCQHVTAALDSDGSCHIHANSTFNCTYLTVMLSNTEETENLYNETYIILLSFTFFKGVMLNFNCVSVGYITF